MKQDIFIKPLCVENKKKTSKKLQEGNWLVHAKCILKNFKAIKNWSIMQVAKRDCILKADKSQKII